MVDALINASVAMVLVFLFGTVAWVRPDDRTRCWFAGWLSLLAASLAQLALLDAAGWERIALASLKVDLTAVAAICFGVAAEILVRGRRFAILLWFVLAIPTVLCLTLSAADVHSRWLLLAAVAARQAPAITMAATTRGFRPGFGVLVATAFVLNAGLMAYFILHGHAGLMVPAILAELFLGAGAAVWDKHAAQTIGMRVNSVGLLLCASVFPVAEITHRIWPQIATKSQLWNLPKVVVVVGMMLMVFEEEVRSARSLARDYRLLFDSNPNPMWILNVATLEFLAVNDAACALHGYTKKEFLTLRLPDIVHPEARERASRGAKGPTTSINPAARHLRKDGSEFPMDITSHRTVFQGKPCRFVLGLDVTTREHLERRLEYQLYHDALTCLANRRSFEELLGDAVARATKTGEKLTLLCLDLYHLKRLNEVYGPQIGDACIQYVASVLTARTRGADFVARTGDDEFAIVLTELRDFSFAEEITSYLHESFKDPVFLGEYEIQLSFCLGVAVCPDDGADAITLWHLAQTALRRAQAKGSGQTVWLSPELRAEAERSLEVAATMSRMVEEGYFRLVYQPLYADDGTLRGMEALLRLNHPRFGPISPLSVIRAAEESGSIELLGQWVFEEACRQIQAWMDQGIRMVPVAINVSSLQLMRKGFAERLAQTLERFGVNSQWVHLEITETAAMDNLQAVSGEMMVLSALGCRFSIDDFGTGHSSLERLHRLPISILKIDRSFIVSLCHCGGNGSDDTSMMIVQAILSMAHALGLQVVAEGVETEQQLACLRRLGCDFYQGFLLSRPVEPEQIPALMARKHPLFRAAPERTDERVDQEGPKLSDPEEAGITSED